MDASIAGGGYQSERGRLPRMLKSRVNRCRRALPTRLAVVAALRAFHSVCSRHRPEHAALFLNQCHIDWRRLCFPWARVDFLLAASTDSPRTVVAYRPRSSVIITSVRRGRLSGMSHPVIKKGPRMRHTRPLLRINRLLGSCLRRSDPPVRRRTRRRRMRPPS